MLILAVDPGPVQSALVTYDVARKKPLAFATLPNTDCLERIRDARSIGIELVAVEMIASYGMAVGAEVFETCVWIGQYLCEARHANLLTQRIFRREVKKAVCHNSQAKDSNIRQALIDRFGGETALIRSKTCSGKKHDSPEAVTKVLCKCGGSGRIGKDGPLARTVGDEWAALGVAVTYDVVYSTVGSAYRNELQRLLT